MPMDWVLEMIWPMSVNTFQNYGDHWRDPRLYVFSIFILYVISEADLMINRIRSADNMAMKMMIIILLRLSLLTPNQFVVTAK